MLKESNVAEIQDTIFIIKNMSDDERIKETARMREKTLHDRATALSFTRAEGRAEGRAEIIARMRALGFDENTIQSCMA